MSCSSSVVNAADTAEDLYRDSFKYFKNYVPSLSSSLSPLANRKKRFRRFQQRSTAVTVQTKDDQPNERKKSEEEQPSIMSSNGNGREDSGNDSSSMDFEVTSESERILLRHPKDPDNHLENSIIKRGVTYDFDCHCHQMWGLRSPETWSVVELTFPRGLIVIRNPFTAEGQRYWISRTLLDFPHHTQYITNMDNLNRLEMKNKGAVVDKLEDFKLETCGRNFYEKLRWVTFGYHHDWDTKVYTEERKSNFPDDLADMTRYISQVLDFLDFEAEAAIANYYHMDSTLSGHVDKSEVNQFAPLFSLSFGQTAIFLIGGKTKFEKPQPVLLQSGDIAIMSGESRLSYHGVPKILPASIKSWDATEHGHNIVKDDTCKRPKMDAGFNQEKSVSVSSPSVARAHNCKSFNTSLKDPDVGSRLGNVPWTNFLNTYINKSRINLNIRQVLFPGQSCLYSDAMRK